MNPVLNIAVFAILVAIGWFICGIVASRINRFLYTHGWNVFNIHNKEDKEFVLYYGPISLIIVVGQFTRIALKKLAGQVE